MKFIVFAVLGIIAFALIAGFVIGLALEIIGLVIMALIVVAAVSFVLRKVRGNRHRSLERERLPR